MEDELYTWCHTESNLSNKTLNQIVKDITGEEDIETFVAWFVELVKKETQCFLETPVTPRPSLTERSAPSPQGKATSSVCKFDDEFPSLSASLAPAVVQKKKKRIRSTLISSTTSQRKSGNISSIPDSLTVSSSSHITSPHKSFGGSTLSNVNPTSTAFQVGFKQTSTESVQSLPPPSSPLKTRTISEPMASPMSPRAHLSQQKLSLDETTASVIDCLDIGGKPIYLKRLAHLYGILILKQQLNRLHELNFLYRLLCCAHASISSGGIPLLPDQARYFTCPLDCLVFTTSVFQETCSLIQSIDPRIQSMFINDPICASLCPDLITRLISSVAKKAASLSATQRVRVGMGGRRGIALPFREETDSRHHFRSQEQSRLFVNREACRDSFLKLYRSYRDVRREFDDKKAVKLTQEFPSEVTNVVSSVHQANIQWFGALLVDHLAATSLEVENEEVRGALANTDIGKLESLSQRMSSKPVTSSLMISSEGRIQDKKTVRNSSDSKNPSHGDFSLNHILGEPSELFNSIGESFFYEFLSVVHDHHLLRHIHGLLALRLSSVTKGWLNAAKKSANDDPLDSGIDDTLDSLVSMRIFAKFLGWICFRSHWSVSAIAVQAQSLALNTAVNDAIEVESILSSPPPLKPTTLLREAREHGILVLVVPWLVEYLRLLKWDVVTRKTQYFECILIEMRHLQHDLLNSPLNDNLTLVSLELELLFADLALLSPLPPVPTSSQLLELKGVDATSLIAQRIYLRHMCLGVEELLNGLRSSRKSFHASSVISKKLRPHVVSPYAPNHISHSTLRSTNKDDSIPYLLRQMQVSFFQRYPELQVIADFVVNTVLKNCVDLAIKELEGTKLWSEGSRGSRSARQLAKMVIDSQSEVVSSVMTQLAPPSVSSQVKVVAIQLTIKQVKSVGISVVTEALMPHVKRLQAFKQSQDSFPSRAIDRRSLVRSKSYTSTDSMEVLLNILAEKSVKISNLQQPNNEQELCSFAEVTLSIAIKEIASGSKEAFHVLPSLLEDIHCKLNKGTMKKSDALQASICQVMLSLKTFEAIRECKHALSTFSYLCCQLVHYRFIEPVAMERRLLMLFGEVKEVTQFVGQRLIESLQAVHSNLYFHHLEAMLISSREG